MIVAIGGWHNCGKHEVGVRMAKRLEARYVRLGADVEDGERYLDVWSRRRAAFHDIMRYDVLGTVLPYTYEHVVVTGVLDRWHLRLLRAVGALVYWIRTTDEERSYGGREVVAEWGEQFVPWKECTQIICRGQGFDSIVEDIYKRVSSLKSEQICGIL